MTSSLTLAMLYLTALGLTLLIEAPVYWGGLRYMLGRPGMLSLKLAIGVNLATHPVLYFLAYPGLTGVLGVTAGASLAESLVMLAEWGLLHRLSSSRSDWLLILSLVSNAASFTLGQVLLR